MMRRVFLPALSLVLVLSLQAPAEADFCSGLQSVVRIASSDDLASIGTGDFYTGPDSAGHTGVDFPEDDTQRTTTWIEGATLCGVNTLPRGIGTHRYSCEFDSNEQSVVSQVKACYPEVEAQRDSEGEGTNWLVKVTSSQSASVNVWAIEAGRIRITISPAGTGDDDLPF